jgi:co-chaperonin GroES (HSP10)
MPGFDVVDIAVLKDRILLRCVDEGTTAEIVSVGDNISFVPGQIVHINPYTGTKVAANGSTYVMVREEDILDAVDDE